MSERASDSAWDRVWKKPDGWYPNEFIVRFLAKYVRKRTGLTTYETIRSDINRVLDLGCGCGRHLIMLAREGYDTCGLDISPRAIEFAGQWLEHEGLKAGLRVGSAANLPWGKESFDLVIAHGVLDHMTWEDTRQVTKEVARVLQPQGLFYVDLVSTGESGYGRGQQLDRYTYRIEEGDEAGTIQRFYEMEHIPELLSDSFEILDVVHDKWEAVFGAGFSALAQDKYVSLARFHIAARKP